MTHEEANELFRQYRKTGDIEIRNKLIENYMYVAEILAKKFVGRGVEYDDLLQIASEALISGVEKFDPDMGNVFTTYVTPTVTGIIRNYFRDYSGTLRVPRKLYSLNAKIRTAVSEYYNLNGTKPTAKQLAEMLGVREEDVIEATECHSPISLDMTVKGEDSEVPLYEVIADENPTFEKFEDNESLKTEIKKLSPMEQSLLALRFIDGKSQVEVGKILGVSQMFVSRAERKIVEKLRESLSK